MVAMRLQHAGLGYEQKFKSRSTLLTPATELAGRGLPGHWRDYDIGTRLNLSSPDSLFTCQHKVQTYTQMGYVRGPTRRTD